jgi:hypothetical protein
MNVVLFLLFLALAISIAAGIIRKLRGGSFLPEPAPGEEHFKDRSGRWWRESDDGTVEESI